MRLVLAALVVTMATAPAVNAGAWLRSKGAGFGSVSATSRGGAAIDGVQTDISVFAEYGLAERLTLGLDVFERPGTGGHVLLFSRLPLVTGDGPNRLALELGIGGHHDKGNWDPMYKAALAFGRGLRDQGWLAADLAVEVRTGQTDPLFKFDVTYGFPGQYRFRPMVQLETAYADGFGFGWAVIPSLIYTDQNSRRWVMGLEARSAKTHSFGVKLGIWQNF